MALTGAKGKVWEIWDREGVLPRGEGGSSCHLEGLGFHKLEIQNPIWKKALSVAFYYFWLWLGLARGSGA